MSRNKVKEIVKQYAEILRQQDFKFFQLYLFGSYAIGKPNAGSDIDVAVIAPFTKKNYWEIKRSLWRLAPYADTRIEPILLSKKDFEKGNTQLAFEVKKTGVKIQ